MIDLIEPYGGSLVDLAVSPENRESLIAEAGSLPSAQLSARALCDLELMATGGFSPVDRFMGAADLKNVLAEMRLDNGMVFPIPITLPVEHFEGLSLDKKIALRDARNDLLAVMTVEEIYEWSRTDLEQHVLGTTDPRHPLVTELQHWGRFNLSGEIKLLNMPRHADFADLRRTPHETRTALASLGRSSVVAFQTRNPIHRAHEEITKLAAAEIHGTILLHPVVGVTKPGDVDYFTRVRTYRVLAEKYYDRGSTLLALLPLAMRMAGPREAVWHAIIRRNYGASHFIVGRDHASPGLDSKGHPFYQPDAAQALARQFSEEIGVKIMAFGEMVFSPERGRYVKATEVSPGEQALSLSGTQIRSDYLGSSRPLPDWFTRPEVAEILADSHPPPEKQGFCLWFTGLSGAGKSATAEAVSLLLNERGRRVTMLDGDVVRTHLSKGLGFTREDRDTNVLRIGFVASEIVRHGGVAICAAVSPFRQARNEVRQMIGDDRFIEVFVDTPLETCERRDTKGMYAKARRGEITGFTGIDDPYEKPETAEITIETVSRSIDENARRIFEELVKRGFVP